jgi:hypothetical protein
MGDAGERLAPAPGSQSSEGDHNGDLDGMSA